jgi:hypothetical protein
MLYELYRAFLQPDGSWNAESGAKYDLRSNALRPAGWTSADAAGLPIFPGLVRYDEVAAGEINHAIRFTVPRTRREYVWPARHFASDSTDPALPPMGQRFRLKAGVNISGYSAPVQVILRAMKAYGLILADNGSAWYISGAPDERWDNSMLHEMDNIHGSDFEAVDCSSLMIHPDSGQAAAPGALTLRAPDGGETWTRASVQEIAWSAGTLGGKLKIFLYRNGKKLGLVASGVDPGAGSYLWTVGKYGTSLAPVGTGYAIRIQSGSDPSVYDASGASFSIVPPVPPAIVTAPNGGESWTRLSTQNITWTTTFSGTIKILLFRNGGQVGVIATGVSAAAGGYAWVVGKFKGGTAPAGTGYRIRIKPESAGLKYDDGNGPFAIR